MNRMKKRKLTDYIIVIPRPGLGFDDILSLNAEYAKIKTHLSRLREIYLSNPKAFPDMPRKLLDAERRRRQLEELLTGNFDLFVVVPEK